MSRDMKNNRRTAPPRQGSPLLLGLIIGALVGIGIAVGAVFFLNRSPSPFNSSAPPNNDFPNTATNSPKLASNTLEIMRPQGNQAVNTVPESAAPELANASAITASHPQNINYDFYKVLSGTEDKKKKENATQTTQVPSTHIEEPKKNGEFKKSYLQIGAFHNEQQADNIKAKLALVGVEAQIRSKDNGTAIIHRVRVGPFTHSEELIRMRDQLKQNGIDSTVVDG